MKLINELTTEEIINQSENGILLCGTCNKTIIKSDTIVDDGIEKGVYHHNYCY